MEIVSTESRCRTSENLLALRRLCILLNCLPVLGDLNIIIMFKLKMQLTFRLVCYLHWPVHPRLPGCTCYVCSRTVAGHSTASVHLNMKSIFIPVQILLTLH